MMHDQELKAKWVDALRSGKYIQGYDSLRKLVFPLMSPPVYKYCCLGVLIQVCPSYRWITNATAVYNDAGIVTSGELNTSELKDLGIAPDQHNLLIGMNDKEKLNFNQIADWIEANL